MYNKNLQINPRYGDNECKAAISILVPHSVVGSVNSLQNAAISTTRRSCILSSPQFSAKHTHQFTYRLAANTTSRLIAAEPASICSKSAVLPITRAASRSCRHISSRRTTVRTMLPSMMSVSVLISSKGSPKAHLYTTCATTATAEGLA